MAGPTVISPDTKGSYVTDHAPDRYQLSVGRYTGMLESTTRCKDQGAWG